MLPAAFRETYMGDAVATASPAQILVMLCDRLVLDIQRGIEASERGEVIEAHNQYMHAQDILTHLRTSLDVNAGWADAPKLISVYAFLEQHLFQANVAKDTTKAIEALGLAAEIADIWRQAVAAAAAGVAQPVAV